MALPATDDFNRANGAPGANWTGSVGGDLTIDSNTIRGAGVGTDNSMYWSADLPDAAQYAQCKIVTAAVGLFRGPTIRSSGTDWVVLDADQATRWLIEWYNGGAFTAIGSAYGTAPAANDLGKITADGSAFKGYVNDIERISGTNGSAPSTGYGGIYSYGHTGSVDDFEVGNLTQKRWILGPH